MSLKPGKYQVIGQSSACGTPGCLLPNWHNGPHTLEQVACRSDQKRETVIRRSPRFIAVPFPWQALGLDLQALVLLQLADEACELLLQLSRFARALRPMRAAILRAVELDDGIGALLSSSFAACARKLGSDPSPLRGAFSGAHHAGEPNGQLDEHMHVELRLVRPRLTPRSWKWALYFRMWTSNTECHHVRLAAVQVFYTPSERIGQPRHGGRKRVHQFCAQQGHVYAEDDAHFGGME